MPQIIYNIPQNHCAVIERFGKFARIQNAGLNFRIPFIETVRRLDQQGANWGEEGHKMGWQIELTEQQLDTKSRDCFTKDNAKVHTNAIIFWRLQDVRKGVYEVDELPRAVTNAALNALRSNIGSMDLDEVLSRRQELNDAIAAQLSDSGKKWGVQFLRVEIQELQTDKDTSDAMLQQLDAERKRRAHVAESEGKAKAEVTLANSYAEAAKIRAEGEAAALEIMSTAEAAYLEKLSAKIPVEEASRVLLAQKTLNGFATITRNPADKVFLPSDFNGILGVDSSK